MLIMDNSPQILAKLQLGDIGTALESGSEVMMKSLGQSAFLVFTLESFSLPTVMW